MEVRVLFCLILLSFVHHGICVPTDDLLQETYDYVKNMEIQLERKYEARFKALEADVKTLKSDFAVKENETLESTVDQLREGLKDRPETSIMEEQETPLPKVAKTTKVQSKQNTVGIRSRDVGFKTVEKRQALSQTENKIAFFASLTHDTHHMGANQDIAFDKVVTNLGSAYNGHHGTFIAPVSGTYVLFATLLSWVDSTWGHFLINGSIVAKLSVAVHGTQSSQTIIVHLNKGDDVSVQNTATDKTLSGGMYSTFGGFLLYADPNSEIVG